MSPNKRGKARSVKTSYTWVSHTAGAHQYRRYQIKAIFLVIFLTIFSCATYATEKIDYLWKAFYIEAKASNFNEPVKLYEVNSDFTKICFVYKNSVFLFDGQSIKKVEHAKIFNVSGINRITYKKNSIGDDFYLWSNESLVLTIGS